MQLVIDQEYQRFLKEIKEPEYIFGYYMDETEYEDEHSHNAIYKAMEILKNKIIKYLHENRPGEFIVDTGWCIHVMTINKAKQLCISEKTIEMCVAN